MNRVKIDLYNLISIIRHVSNLKYDIKADKFLHDPQTRHKFNTTLIRHTDANFASAIWRSYYWCERQFPILFWGERERERDRVKHNLKIRQRIAIVWTQPQPQGLVQVINTLRGGERERIPAWLPSLPNCCPLQHKMNRTQISHYLLPIALAEKWYWAKQI